MSFKSMKEEVNKFKNNNENQVIFLHIREPKEIERAVKEFNAKTILVVRDTIKHITSNMADQNVFNYNYDFVINNDGTKSELNSKAKKFVEEVIL